MVYLERLYYDNRVLTLQEARQQLIQDRLGAQTRRKTSIFHPKEWEEGKHTKFEINSFEPRHEFMKLKFTGTSLVFALLSLN